MDLLVDPNVTRVNNMNNSTRVDLSPQRPSGPSIIDFNAPKQNDDIIVNNQSPVHIKAAINFLMSCGKAINAGSL